MELFSLLNPVRLKEVPAWPVYHFIRCEAKDVDNGVGCVEDTSLRREICDEV
jgi:hypothetical protein